MNKLLIVFFCLICFTLQAQDIVEVSRNKNVKILADELYSKKKYSAASEAYTYFIEQNKDKFSIEIEMAYFYKASCDIELFRPDGIKQMEFFLKQYPESVFLTQAYFKLAIGEFRNKNYFSALCYFEKINPMIFEKSQMDEFYFKRAYCNLKLGNEEDAVSDFYNVKDSDGEYKIASMFYYGYISLKNKKYQIALESFLKIENEFSDVIPFYLVQVYFAQRDYDKVIEQGERIYSSLDEDYKLALARMLANSFFCKENYSETIHYYEKYFNGGIEPERKDKFEYGYSLYKEKKYDRSVSFLQKVGGEDRMSQIAAFTIADCYLKAGNKQKARIALGNAANMDYDKRIAEVALFNYAKINYELSSSPLNETINTFDEYISKYPDSGRNDEAYDYLVNAYMKTRNYSAALNSMEKIKYKTSKIKEAYQKVAFNRGVELFKDYQFSRAIDFFDKSLKYKMFNKSISASALYWKAEAFYRQGKYIKAIDVYNKFLDTPGASLTDNYNDAYYGLAYSYLGIENYSKSVELFKIYEINDRNQSSVQLADVRNRMADYYMYDRNYELSIIYYNKVIDQDTKYTEYALYKKSVLQGLIADYIGQKQTVDKLLLKYPNTEYYEELSYEIGNVLLTQNKNKEAEIYYNNILMKENDSEYIPMAKLQLGLLNFNTNNYSKAEKYYKYIIENYKGTQYSQTASIGLKNVMVESNRVNEYFKYIDKQGLAKPAGISERDSLHYISAERKYMDEDYESAIKSFEEYLHTYPDGLFVMNANYYIANSYVSRKQEDMALIAYERILDYPVNSYTLEAVKFAAKKNYSLSNYSKSLKQYSRYAEIATSYKQKNEANIGVVYSAYNLKEFSKVIKKGIKIIENNTIVEKEKINILYMLSDAYRNTGDRQNMLYTYKKLKDYSANSKGAEAWFLYAQFLFNDKQYKESEAEINKFMETNTPHHYWLAKSFMLLSDIYLVNKDEFQAKYTLKSVIENYHTKEDGIIKEAEKKLESIINKEKNEEKIVKVKNDARKPIINLDRLEEYNRDFEKHNKKDDKVVEEGKKILEEMMKENTK